MQWERWIAFGGDPDNFWRQTPLTFAIFMRGRAQTLKWQRTGEQFVAWSTAYLQRVNRFPSWEEFTDTRREKTEAELMSAGRLLAAAGFATIYEPPQTEEAATS